MRQKITPSTPHLDHLATSGTTDSYSRTYIPRNEQPYD